MNQINSTSVVAVVVTYQPNLSVLGQLLDALTPQVESVVIVDNGSQLDSSDWRKQSETRPFALLPLGENRGIASAQNLGIQWARDYVARFVLLIDQDSIPAPDMVANLRSAILEQVAPSSAGPCYIDSRQENPPPFIQVRGLRLKRIAWTVDDAIVPVDYLISSGCLIPMTVLNKVGGMREDLFIDYVDIEWGLRARHYGLQSYGVFKAKMQHSLGDRPSAFFGRKIPVHSPLRHYYHFRNAVLLYREAWIPLNWKLVDGWRLLLKYGFYTLFAKPRLKHFRMMSHGILHGLLGKAGKFGMN